MEKNYDKDILNELKKLNKKLDDIKSLLRFSLVKNYNTNFNDGSTDEQLRDNGFFPIVDYVTEINEYIESLKNDVDDDNE